MSLVHSYDDHEHSTTDNPLVGLVYLLSGVLVLLLALRFIFILFGINNVNQITSIVYGWTEPLVRPFYGFLGNNLSYAGNRLEIESILAILAVAIIASILAFFLKLVFH